MNQESKRIERLLPQKTLVLALLLLAFFVVSIANGTDEIEATRALIKVVDSTNIPAEKEGVLRSIEIKIGDLIQKDQAVAKIDDGDAKLKYGKVAVEHQIAERASRDDTIVKFAEKSHAVSLSELKRATDANDEIDLAISESEIDRLRLIVDRSSLEIEKAKIDFDVNKLTEKLRRIEKEQIQNDLAKFQIKSPTDGLVVSVEKQTGEWVKPGETIARIVRINVLRVEGQIPVEQASLKLKGAEVIVTLATDQVGEKASKRMKVGKVIFVSLEANPIEKRVKIVAEIDNSDLAFRPGLPVKMVVKTDKVLD